MPPQYHPLGNPNSRSIPEQEFQEWLINKKIPVFERLGLDHTVVSLQPIQGGARLKCPVCTDSYGNHITVETNNEVKKHRHEVTGMHKAAVAHFVHRDPADFMSGDICPRCHKSFSRGDSLRRHRKTCGKNSARTKTTSKGHGVQTTNKEVAPPTSTRTTRTRSCRGASSSSRESSAEWTPPSAPVYHPYPRTLRSSTRKGHTTPYRSTSIAASSSSSSLSPPSSPEPCSQPSSSAPSSSTTPMTSRSASPLASEPAAELCLDLEGLFFPSSGGSPERKANELFSPPAAVSPESSPMDDVFPALDPFPASPFPAQAATPLTNRSLVAILPEYDTVFDAYRGFDEGEYPMCALSDDFTFRQPYLADVGLDALDASPDDLATVDPFGPQLDADAFGPTSLWDWPSTEPAREFTSDEEFAVYLNDIFS